MRWVTINENVPNRAARRCALKHRNKPGTSRERQANGNTHRK